jgi:restriction endonuclease S subunit
MNKLTLKTISLDDEDYFKLAIGKRLLKRDLFRATDNPKAIIPVYSANVYSPFGLVEKSNVKDFTNPYVLWGIDGNFDLNFKNKGEIFATTDHCGSIEILSNKINPEYLLLLLNLKRLEYGFDRGLRSNLVNIKRLELDFPVDEKGEFDERKQKIVVKKNNQILQIQNRINKIRDAIERVKLNFFEDFDYEEKPLEDLFIIKQGNAHYTKKLFLGNHWEGNIPVYSSNTKEKGLLMKIDINKVKKQDIYYLPCLTWAVDGYAGKVFIRNEKNIKREQKEEFYFTINNHSGILLPKDEKIFLPFIRWSIQPIFFSKAKGYGNNKLGTNQIEGIVIKIPLNKKGEFDIEKQKKIASRYELIEKLKNDLIEKLDSLAKYHISVN